MNPKLTYISSTKKGESNEKLIKRIESLEKANAQLKKQVDNLTVEVQGLKGKVQ